jgi:hypothetical protein
MTASTVKSASITGFDSVPVTLETGAEYGNKFRIRSETLEVATTSIDEADDVIKMIRVKSRDRIYSVKIFNDDMDTHSTPTLAVDVGFYNAQTGAVKDADALASAVTTLQAANTAGVEVAWEAHDIADMGKTAWELAGYTSDPGVPLDIALTVTTGAATAAAGTLSMQVVFSNDN